MALSSVWIIGLREEYSTKTERTVGEQKERRRGNNTEITQMGAKGV
jgi:hypothetical protein